MITKEIRIRVENALKVDLNQRNTKGKHIRPEANVMGRAIYYGICREITPLSLQQIGDTLGQDHATVLHQIRNNFKTMEHRKDKRYIEVYRDIIDEVKPIQARLRKEAQEARDYISLLDENEDLRRLLDSALEELNNEENYIQRYIMAKTQLGYLKSVVKKTSNLATAKKFVDSISNTEEQ